MEKKKKKGALELMWKQRQLQVFVWMGLLFLLVFNYFPMFGIIIAFKDYKLSSGIVGMFTSKWVGLKFFKEFFTEYNFGDLMRNTLVLSILKLIFTFPLPIILALVLNEVHNTKLKKVTQVVSYLPYFISWVIVAGLCQILLNSTGTINSVIKAFGGTTKNFLSDKKYFYWVAVISAMWKETGWWAIIFLAAITSIDPSLYESASIDGASRMQKIRFITFPGISSTITVVLILALGGLLGGGLSGSNFEQCYLLGNSSNAEFSEIIQTYVLNIGLSKGRYSYATAAGLFQSVISVVLVFTSNFFANKISGEGLF